jgi:hypothetical protein
MMDYSASCNNVLPAAPLVSEPFAQEEIHSRPWKPELPWQRAATVGRGTVSRRPLIGRAQG